MFPVAVLVSLAVRARATTVLPLRKKAYEGGAANVAGARLSFAL